MLPSDMNLHIVTIQGYSNKIRIATSTVNVWIQVDVNAVRKAVSKPVEKKFPTHTSAGNDMTPPFPPEAVDRTEKPRSSVRGTVPIHEAVKHDDTKTVLVTTGVVGILAYILLK